MKEIKITFDHTGVKSVTEMKRERNVDMKPFNLEEYEAGKPLCDYKGNPVRVICTDAMGSYPIVLLSNWYEDSEEVIRTTADYAGVYMAEETIEINGHKVPKPETEFPAIATPYYSPDPAATELYHTSTWDGTKFDQRMLSRGVIHLTKEAALKHAEALLSFTRKGD